ncbi:MAG: bifunctional diaminohydroxyphosphoribosylaminopyrimidine deaminase/5-amino-6-(5-phosphoribosylamino)uracil reductase RibD [Ilumatobacteraceae bacterium]
MESHPASERRGDDVRAWMTRAVDVAWSARTRARPNPWVGAVLVCTDGRMFDGATSQPGGPHAEVAAIAAARAAGAPTAGATLVCTLEPCDHTGRTGPCTGAIIEAGISRVVHAIDDPDSRVAGSGRARLTAAGIAVESGVMADEVSEQLAPYLHHRRTGRPFVVLKMALTLDSRTVAPAGVRWITGDDARTRVHALRAESDAIVVGIGTVLADDPELTVRHVEGPSPRRIVMSRNRPVPTDALVNPCDVWTRGIDELLDGLGREGALQVLVEGGATVATAFHTAGLVDRYVLHVAPTVSGDASAPGLFTRGTHEPSALSDNRLVAATVLGNDLEIVLEPKREKDAA